MPLRNRSVSANTHTGPRRKETPPPGAGTRVFYESLYKQNPHSLMALKYCVEYGCLPREECEKAVEKLEKMKLAQKEAVRNRAFNAVKTEEAVKKRRVKEENESTEVENQAPPPPLPDHDDLPHLS